MSITCDGWAQGRTALEEEARQALIAAARDYGAADYLARHVKGDKRAALTEAGQAKKAAKTELNKAKAQAARMGVGSIETLVREAKREGAEAAAGERGR